MRPGDTDQFFRSTRGRIILLLMRGEQTVNELADQLELTDNAVRSHLVALERDGVVRQTGERRSGGRPAYLYDVAPAADELFPKAYEAGMLEIVRVLGGRLDPAELYETLAEAGRNSVERSPGQSPDRRAERVTEMLEDRGGVAATEEDDRGRLLVRSACCPLSGIVTEHRACCHFVRGMIEGVLDADAEVRCEFGERPNCCFRVRRPLEEDGEGLRAPTSAGRVCRPAGAGSTAPVRGPATRPPSP